MSVSSGGEGGNETKGRPRRRTGNRHCRFPARTATWMVPLLGLHPSHHLSLRGVQLSLAPLARFFEVLVTTQIGENSSLLTLLLEPAKGTLEGLAFFDPDAGHPMNRLL